jgi:phenylpyruvate tautomerase PptA (4-oxalocrotonate tautomerase family)
MPMLDAYIPRDALPPGAERELIEKLTDLLLEHEGVDPANETGRHFAWVSVHRPEVYVAGRTPRSPRYRFICQVPEGQYDDERRDAVTAGITRAVAEAEAGAWPRPEARVCVFTLEVPDGNWGGAGRVIRLPDIYELVWPLVPDMEGEPRESAERVLAERRQGEAKALLAAAGEERLGASAPG